MRLPHQVCYDHLRLRLAFLACLVCNNGILISPSQFSIDGLPLIRRCKADCLIVSIISSYSRLFSSNSPFMDAQLSCALPVVGKIAYPLAPFLPLCQPLIFTVVCSPVNIEIPDEEHVTLLWVSLPNIMDNLTYLPDLAHPVIKCIVLVKPKIIVKRDLPGCCVLGV